MQGIGLGQRTMLDRGTAFYLRDRPLAGDRDNTNGLRPALRPTMQSKHIVPYLNLSLVSNQFYTI
jgi:hypothetical protein